MATLKAEFPTGSPYAGFRVNEADPRYVEARTTAERLGLSQAQWGGMLELEAQRVSQATVGAENARTGAAAPAAEPKVDVSKLSTRDQFHHALMNGPKPATVEQTRFLKDTTWAANRRG